MAKPKAAYEAREVAGGPSQASTQIRETDEMLKRLADLKEKKAQMEAERCDLDRKLEDSRQEIDEMKRDVEVLNNLDPPQYQQLEEEMTGFQLADSSKGSDAQAHGEVYKS